MLYGLLAVVLMAMDQRGHYVPKLRSMTAYLVEPVYHAVEWPVRAMRNLYSQFQSRRSLRHENERLKAEALSQQAALQRLDTLVEENRRLRALFEGAEAQQFEYRFAELIRVDLDPFSHKVIIDRGADDGVVTGQAVIDGAGVMGQVEDVQPHFSTVRLISDPNHALPVQINRTGLRTVAFGSGDANHLSLPSVPLEADVREGDLIVTSGLGDRFPGGYPVARVMRIEREVGQTFARVLAAPLAALGRGREVLLLKIAEPRAAGENGSPPSAAGETAALPQQADSESDAERTLPPNESAGEARDE